MVIDKMRSLIGEEFIKSYTDLYEMSHVDFEIDCFEKIPPNNKDNDIDRDCFELTLNDYKLKSKEIFDKIGEFNYSAIEDIHPNPNRIFIPLKKYNNGIY